MMAMQMQMQNEYLMDLNCAMEERCEKACEMEDDECDYDYEDRSKFNQPFKQMEKTK